MRKTQNAKRKTPALPAGRQSYKHKLQSLKFLILIFSFTLFALCFALDCYAKDIAVIYTGETHAMLYPCSCPIQPDGGVARRLTLIKQLRKKYPANILLDSGAFFAGGLSDEYTQNTDLDKQRTNVNIKAMELAKYDAVTLGDEEFNFGKEFLDSVINNSSLKFLSANASIDKAAPYLIKDIAGVKIGIIGITSLAAMPKSGGLKFTEPKAAVEQAVGELKKQGVNIIILLSHLGESEDTKILKNIKGIDILVSGHSRDKDELSTKVGDSLLVRPSWQGRRLGVVTFSVKDNKVINPKVEEERLSDQVADDKEILNILPRCFADINCKDKGVTGTCENPGTMSARCLFAQAAKVNLQIITVKNCIVCETESMASLLKKQFPGITVSYLYYPERKAEGLVKDLGITGLPVYLLGKEIEKEKNFDNFKNNLELKKDMYMLKQQASGVAYFIDRKPIKGRLDLFLSLFDKDTAELLGVVKDFNPVIHFLAVSKDDKFEAAKGRMEIEECLRGVCVQKYYPEKFYDYISCRSENITSSWWEDCLKGADVAKIKTCAQGEEGSALLKENIGLNKELQVMFGPAYLMDNKEIFGTKGVPSKEELKKILKR